MQTALEYIEKTESAMRRLFEGVDSYFNILRNTGSVCFESSTMNDEDRKIEFEEWYKKNNSLIKASLVAQREFVAESFAQSSLYGAVLQIASKAIELYSNNKLVPPEWVSAIDGQKNAIRFCLGRQIRGIPLGLIIYAGRNQHTHFKDENLREPSRTVFERLASRCSNGSGILYRDPAFDLTNDRLDSYAGNVVSLIGWKTYEDYRIDIHAILDLK